MNKMLLRAVSLTALAIVAASAFGQSDPQRDFVATDKDAFLMMPADVVCGPKVRSMTWSPDGERLLIERQFTDLSKDDYVNMLTPGAANKMQPIESETQIIAWNTVTRKATTLYRLREKDGVINEMNWMTGSSQALVVATYFDPNDSEQTRTTLFTVNGQGSTKMIAPINTRLRYSVEPSPYRPLVGFVEYPTFIPTRKGDPPAAQNPPSVRFFGIDGVLSQPIQFLSPGGMLFWSSDGRAYSISFDHDPKTKSVKKKWAFANMSTHKFEPCEAPKDSGFGAPAPDAEIGVSSLPAKVSFKKLGINAPTIIVEATAESKDSEPGVVTTDGKDGQLSPKFNAVSYVSQGTAMVRPMVKVPLELFHKAKDAALRTELLSKAKQVGLALLMYANDYDDNLLSNQGDWKNAIDPYLKNMEMLDGFNYSFGGGDMNKIESPATTPLGFFEGNGGRAYVYSDGHAQWVPNP